MVFGNGWQWWWWFGGGGGGGGCGGGSGILGPVLVSEEN